MFNKGSAARRKRNERLNKGNSKKKDKPEPIRFDSSQPDIDKQIELIKELSQQSEIFVPELPLRFDDTGKLLIYHTDSLYSERRKTKIAMLIPTCILYCGMRAI